MFKEKELESIVYNVMTTDNTDAFYEKIVELLVMSQQEVHDLVKKVTKDHILEEDPGHFIYVDPWPDFEDKPVLICHLDTVNTDQKPLVTGDFYKAGATIHINKKAKDRVRCLGGDDRCGVLAALELYKSRNTNETKFSWLFCWDEEIGMHGSTAFSYSEYFNKPGCYIGLDRRARLSGLEVATYGHDNQDLIDTFTHEGFRETGGSMSDCSTLSDYSEYKEEGKSKATSTACVNVSVGYDNEHTTGEVIYITSLERTIQKLRTIHIPNIWYTAEPEGYSWRGGYQGWREADEYYQSYTHYTGASKAKPVVCDWCLGHEKLFKADTGDMLCASCLRFDVAY